MRRSVWIAAALLNTNDNDVFLLAARVSGTAWGLPVSIAGGINALTAEDQGVALAADFGFDSTPSSPSRAIASAETVRTWLSGVNYLVKGNDLKLLLHFLHSDTGAKRNRLFARLQVIF